LLSTRGSCKQVEPQRQALGNEVDPATVNWEEDPAIKAKRRSF